MSWTGCRLAQLLADSPRANHIRYDMYMLKRHGLPFLYWNLMLKGLA